MVTGAASGIGAALASYLEEMGARVVGLDTAPVEAAPASVIAMSVTDESAWQDAVDETVDRFGQIDGLVNCAGIIRMGDITAMSADEVRAMLDVNVMGPFLGMKHVLPVMYRQSSGSIVNMSSTAGLAGAAGAAGYCASKGAVRLMTKATAMEAIGKKSRVRVNSVHPALTETPMADDIVNQVGGGEETRKAMLALLPGGELIPVRAVVDTIVFLLSDASSHLNGSEVVVDNGFTAQ